MKRKQLNKPMKIIIRLSSHIITTLLFFVIITAIFPRLFLGLFDYTGLQVGAVLTKEAAVKLALMLMGNLFGMVILVAIIYFLGEVGSACWDMWDMIRAKTPGKRKPVENT
jgi:hypothetical protein